MARYRRTILGTCCIPWNEDDTFAEQIFRRSVRNLLAHGLTDLYIFGTAGEGYAVTESQFDRITQVFHEEMTAGGSQPMVGVISMSLGIVLDRIERSMKAGMRQFQISMPSWGTLTQPEMFRFFESICDRFPEAQFLHYNLIRTGRLVTPAEYAELQEKHPNLVATKSGGGDLGTINGLLQRAGKIRHFFTEYAFCYGSLVGECGYLISIGSMNPERARQYFDAGVRRDVDTLLAIFQELTQLSQEMRACVPAGIHMDGAYDKIFSRMLTPEFPLRLLPPYESTPEDAFQRFTAAVRERFPQWAPPR